MDCHQVSSLPAGPTVGPVFGGLSPAVQLSVFSVIQSVSLQCESSMAGLTV